MLYYIIFKELDELLLEGGVVTYLGCFPLIWGPFMSNTILGPGGISAQVCPAWGKMAEISNIDLDLGLDPLKDLVCTGNLIRHSESFPCFF